MKRILMVILLFFVSFSVFAQIQEKVGIIPGGDLPGYVNLEMRYSKIFHGPKSFTIDEKGFLYICDLNNYRLNIYNLPLQFLTSITMESSKEDVFNSISFMRLEVIGNTIWGLPLQPYSQEPFEEKCRIVKITDSGIRGFYGVETHHQDNQTYSTTFINDMAFDWDESGHIWCNPWPSDTIAGADSLPLLDYAGILQYIRDNPEKTKGITLDSKQRLLLNGELYTRSWRVWYEYWTEKIPGFEKDPRHVEQLAPADYPCTYLGQDRDKNTYWIYPEGVIFIINKDNIWFSYVLLSDEPANKIAAVHPSGDLYFMREEPFPEDYSYYRDPPPVRGMELYKIARTW